MSNSFKRLLEMILQCNHRDSSSDILVRHSGVEIESSTVVTTIAGLSGIASSKTANPEDFFFGDETIGLWTSSDDSREGKLLVGNFCRFLKLLAKIGGGWRCLSIVGFEDLETDRGILFG